MVGTHHLCVTHLLTPHTFIVTNMQYVSLAHSKYSKLLIAVRISYSNELLIISFIVSICPLFIPYVSTCYVLICNIAISIIHDIMLMTYLPFIAVTEDAYRIDADVDGEVVGLDIIDTAGQVSS